MLKSLTVIAAFLLVLPSVTHAMSKKPPKSQQVGGTDRPAILVAATPVPESAECKAAKSYASGLRTEALTTLNRYVVQPSSKYSQLEINFYGCREKSAAEALSVAEVSVCGGYLSQAQMQAKLADNLKQCDVSRAAEKLAIANAAKEVVTPVVTPIVAPFIPGIPQLAPSRLPSSASGARSVR